MYRKYLKSVINEAVDSMRFSDLNEICETESKKILLQLQSVIKSELDDFLCVDRIVDIMEGAGYDCGSRHDF